MLITNITNQTILLKGKCYTPDEILQRGDSGINEDKQTEYEEQIFRFLKEWFNPDDTISVQTSGSTGTPKKITVRKQQMVSSAVMTCEYLQLKSEDKILLCLPVHYIAGAMMIVRALVAGLDLYPVAPCGNPLSLIDEHFRMAPLIPMQVYNSFQNNAETEKLKNIDVVIIGGAAIDAALEKKIKSMPNQFYSTYGMTETLSHIALRKINGSDFSPYYTPLNGVSLSLSGNGTLIVEAKHVCDEILQTNDIAKIYKDGKFEILGRKDNVIISGGIKLFAEQIEQKISGTIAGPYAITSVPDSKFGEIVILVISGTNHSETDVQQIRIAVSKNLSLYEIPKKIVTIQKLPETSTGKIDRKNLKDQIVNLLCR